MSRNLRRVPSPNRPSKLDQGRRAARPASFPMPSNDPDFDLALVRASADPSGRAFYALGEMLKAANRHEQACVAYRRTIALASESFEAHVGLAGCLYKLGALAEAQVVAAQALLRRRPCHDGPEAARAYLALGKICYDRLDFKGAIAAFIQATVQNPQDAQAHGNLGLSLHELGFLQDAFTALHQAINLKPDYVVAYNNLAGLLVAMGQLDMAVACSKIALTLAPHNGALHLNHAVGLRLKRDLSGALDALRQAVMHEPDRPEILLELCHLRQQVCDWAGLSEDQSRAMRDALAKGKRVPPFIVLTAQSSRAQQLASARLWMAGASTSRVVPAHDSVHLIDRAAGRIRIGYLSADFHSHATAALIAEVFERHDRTRFETFGYSIGPDDGSALRTRLIASLDHFIDLKDVTSFEAAAEVIRSDRVDVLLDLKGYTQNARSEILAFRPAPIQVNYLGYPGTMGSDLIDYIVGDAHVTPIEHAKDYAENIVHLPDCYQPNDRRRAVASAQLTRAGCGLPQESFVFCSFNNTYKITPEVFAIWMRLLRGAPGSVLWLLTSNDLVASNLRREAASHGIAEDRLVFAPFVSSDQHIARMALADLFLDTVPVNAHTTASEALWMGLPVLTCRGDTFAGRVASSLLHAVHLPELVTDGLADYEATAFRLWREPAVLAKLRHRLTTGRDTAPLFDMVRYVGYYEAALAHMVAREDAGLPPQAFAVTAGSAAVHRLDRI